MPDCPLVYSVWLYNLPRTETTKGRTVACHADSHSYLKKNWHPRFDSVLQSRLECPYKLPETLNGLHNDKNNRREKLAGGLPNLLAAAVELSSVKSLMKIYEVGKCPIKRATFSFSLFRNIGTLLVETLCCAYCRVRDQRWLRGKREVISPIRLVISLIRDDEIGQDAFLFVQGDLKVTWFIQDHI